MRRLLRRSTLTSNPTDDEGNDPTDDGEQTFEQAMQLVGETEERPVRANASTLHGPSMARTYGREVDPDRYGGARGRDLDGAMDRYKTFHAKEPLDVRDLPHVLPARVVCVGDALSVMYRTDKWHEDGDDEDYKHLHDKGEKPYEIGEGVRLYEPAKEYRKSTVGGARVSTTLKAEKPPVKYPEALARLGYCLGFFVRRDDDGEIYELNPRGCDLYSSPSGDMLAVYSPTPQSDGSVGFLAIMSGGGLRVLKDGIDG